MHTHKLIRKKPSKPKLKTDDSPKLNGQLGRANLSIRKKSGSTTTTKKKKK